MTFSVNTNAGALVALRNLSVTTDQLKQTQDRVSTGLKVIGAKDNASSFAIAQGLRADVKANAAVQQGLSNGKGVVDVAIAGTTALSNLLTDMKAKSVEGMNQANTAQQQTILDADYAQMKTQFTAFVNNAVFNGKNLISAASTALNVISTVSGGTITVNAQDMSVVFSTFTNISSVAAATTELTKIDAAITSVSTALGALGGSSRSLQFQNDFINSIADSLTEGLGAVVDADLAKESATLQSLQVKQQLGVQALSIANQAPQILLGLFRGQ
ncbi:MAG: flagellin [Proteobacteria bacterium]|nr:flagellin [Pseudomonadota bacterium]